MNPIIIVVAIAILVGLYKASTKSDLPQSPAACGTAFFIATAGVASILYLLAIVPSSLFYLVASVIAIPTAGLLSGYVAARTKEDTASMNAKIVAGVAFVPYAGICALSLSQMPGWVIIYALASFIPCVIVGLKIYQKRNPVVSNA